MNNQLTTHLAELARLQNTIWAPPGANRAVWEVSGNEPQFIAFIDSATGAVWDINVEDPDFISLNGAKDKVPSAGLAEAAMSIEQLQQTIGADDNQKLSQLLGIVTPEGVLTIELERPAADELVRMANQYRSLAARQREFSAPDSQWQQMEEQIKVLELKLLAGQLAGAQALSELDDTGLLNRLLGEVPSPTALAALDDEQLSEQVELACKQWAMLRTAPQIEGYPREERLAEKSRLLVWMKNIFSEISVRVSY